MHCLNIVRYINVLWYYFMEQNAIDLPDLVVLIAADIRFYYV